MNDQELVLLKQIANAVFAEWGLTEEPPYPEVGITEDPGSPAERLRALLAAAESAEEAS